MLWWGLISSAENDGLQLNMSEFVSVLYSVRLCQISTECWVLLLYIFCCCICLVNYTLYLLNGCYPLMFLMSSPQMHYLCDRSLHLPEWSILLRETKYCWSLANSGRCALCSDCVSFCHSYFLSFSCTLWTKKTPKSFCRIFHKTQSILIKFGIRCLEEICDTVV